MGAIGERPTATTAASRPPNTTLPTKPIMPSAQNLPGAGPEGSERLSFVGTQAYLAPDQLSGDQEARECNDAPEHAERKGLGLDGALCLGQHRRGDSLEGGGALWVKLVDLRYDHGVETGVAHLHPALAVVDAAFEHRPG